MKNSVILDMFMGKRGCNSIHPDEKYYTLLEEASKLTALIKEYIKDEKIWEAFEKLDELQAEMGAVAGDMFYKEGFKLGLALCAEAFADN